MVITSFQIPDTHYLLKLRKCAPAACCLGCQVNRLPIRQSGQQSHFSVCLHIHKSTNMADQSIITQLLGPLQTIRAVPLASRSISYITI